jgi:hypothetical protein
MTRLVGIILGIPLIITAFAGSAFADCHFSLWPNNCAIDRDASITFSIPVFLLNDCNIGGIQLEIITDPAVAILPIDIDFTGSRIEYWEFLMDTTSNDSITRRFVGVANWPGGPQTPPLDTGNGLLFNIIFGFGCNYLENSNVILTFNDVVITDSTGYIIYDDVSIGNSQISIGDDVSPYPRGDANCNGSLTGQDVTYLVNFFRGTQDCACSHCAGDANGDGLIIGGDVTYLVRFFSGFGPRPRDCD